MPKSHHLKFRQQKWNDVIFYTLYNVGAFQQNCQTTTRKIEIGGRFKNALAQTSVCPRCNLYSGIGEGVSGSCAFMSSMDIMTSAELDFGGGRDRLFLRKPDSIGHGSYPPGRGYEQYMAQ